MQRFLHMARQEQVKLTLWKASNIQVATLSEELFQELWSRFSAILKDASKELHSWYELPIFKSTTR